ncbi:MAG: signal recognition particle protein [Alphaproteobacteria bacterium]|nr:signal recognition particle protein [Alphaproteobacteria bacterium]
MFESLSDKLNGVFDKLKRRASLSEADVNEAMREVRVALLEADVALSVVKDFIAQVKEKAVGAEVLKSIKPGQMVVKIVHDALVEMLGTESSELNLKATPPVPILMVGLQGSGKTTTSGKIALWLKTKQKKKVFMASLDVYRPAAQEQLAMLGEQTGVDTLPIIKGQQPVDIAKRAMKEAAKGGYDVVIIDTAGRLHIDENLMQEVKDVKAVVNPAETLLLSDAMIGQDAVTLAKEFNEKIGVTGIVLTRIDGDARGGAALSMRAVTGAPIKFLGVGEKMDALEVFHSDRLAGRILDMGDVISLVEKAAEVIDQEEAEAVAKKMLQGQFDFNDMLKQMQQMKKMGDLKGIMGMIPGMGKIKKQMENANIDNKIIDRQEAMILSMTKKERSAPAIIKASRKKRIAAGSGTSVQEINKLLKQYQQMSSMMKKMKKMGGQKGLMSALNGLMGGGQGGNPGSGSGMGDLSGLLGKMGGMPGGMPANGLGGLDGLGDLDGDNKNASDLLDPKNFPPGFKF